MRQFMDKDFLLTTNTAQTLFHEYAANMPIIDYHCHINPKEIAENKCFENITQVWLGGDHYKWRLMRANGVDEKYITGDASDYDKFIEWAKTLEKAIGNPLYHWSHLELQRYFGYHGILNSKTADDVWNICNEKLQRSDMHVRNIIEQSNVEVICTTDDPIDSLEWHKMIANDNSFHVTVLPAFRPDKAMNIEKPDFLDYINKLAAVSEVKIHSFKTLCDALKNRMDFFQSAGCKVSDHALEYVMYKPESEDLIEQIYAKRLANESLTELEILKYKTAFMLYVGREYDKLGWTMQLHYGTKRDNNTKAFQKIGADTGYDCINTNGSSGELSNFLNALDTNNQLPKTIIYSLNPNDNTIIGTIIGCFQNSTAVAKIQHGSAWWFNDNKLGMIDQMTSLANQGLLANFVGMLTDSRSFLSYTRHEYFRRILCELIGTWVENGEYPCDIDFLGSMVQDISYYNCKRYFKF
jgi:glucuronate isomerase